MNRVEWKEEHGLKLTGAEQKELIGTLKSKVQYFKTGIEAWQMLAFVGTVGAFTGGLIAEHAIEKGDIAQQIRAAQTHNRQLQSSLGDNEAMQPNTLYVDEQAGTFEFRREVDGRQESCHGKFNVVSGVAHAAQEIKCNPK